MSTATKYESELQSSVTSSGQFWFGLAILGFVLGAFAVGQTFLMKQSGQTLGSGGSTKSGGGSSESQGGSSTDAEAPSQASPPAEVSRSSEYTADRRPIPVQTTSAIQAPATNLAEFVERFEREYFRQMTQDLEQLKSEQRSRVLEYDRWKKQQEEQQAAWAEQANTIRNLQKQVESLTRQLALRADAAPISSTVQRPPAGPVLGQTVLPGGSSVGSWPPASIVYRLDEFGRWVESEPTSSGAPVLYGDLVPLR